MWGRILFWFWVLAVLATAILSLTPVTRLPRLGAPDKLVHLIVYAGLAFIPALIFSSAGRAAWTGLGLAAMGAGLELGQLLVPGRSCEALDLAANALGASLGLGLGLLLRPKTVGLTRAEGVS